MILNIFTTGYSPDSELLFIGVRTHTGEVKFWEKEEGFIEYFLGTDDKIVIGFNILKFDIPYILLKTSHSPRFKELFSKMNYCNIVDLFNILTFQNKGIIRGLNHYLEREGVERNFLNDAEIVRIANSERSRAEENASKKLEAIHSLYWKLRGD